MIFVAAMTAMAEMTAMVAMAVLAVMLAKTTVAKNSKIRYLMSPYFFAVTY